MGHHTLLYYCYLFSEEETEKGLTQHEKAKNFGSREHKQRKRSFWACVGGKSFLISTLIIRHKRFGALARHVETVEVLEPRAHWWWWWWWW
jgi:hypothetical protein